MIDSQSIAVLVGLTGLVFLAPHLFRKRQRNLKASMSLSSLYLCQLDDLVSAYSNEEGKSTANDDDRVSDHFAYGDVRMAMLAGQVILDIRAFRKVILRRFFHLDTYISLENYFPSRIIEARKPHRLSLEFDQPLAVLQCVETCFLAISYRSFFFGWIYRNSILHNIQLDRGYAVTVRSFAEFDHGNAMTELLVDVLQEYEKLHHYQRT